MRTPAALLIAAIGCTGVLGCSQAKPEALSMDHLYNALNSSGLEAKDRKPQIAKFIKAEAGEAFDVNGTKCEVYVWDLNTEDGVSGYDNTKQYGLYGGETVMVKNIGVTCKGDTKDGKKVLSIAKEL